MALNLINSENLAVVAGTEKTVGDSLEARVENLEERIAPLESHAKWIQAGHVQPSDTDKTVTIPSGVNPEEFLVAIPSGTNVYSTALIPALAEDYTSGTRTRNYYVGSESAGITVAYTLTANSSGKTYSITYTGSATRGMYVYYR